MLYRLKIAFPSERSPKKKTWSNIYKLSWVLKRRDEARVYLNSWSIFPTFLLNFWKAVRVVFLTRIRGGIRLVLLRTLSLPFYILFTFLYKERCLSNSVLMFGKKIERSCFKREDNKPKTERQMFKATVNAY